MLSGCVFGERNDNEMASIGFDPVIGHGTRLMAESAPFPSDRTFNVWATASDGKQIIADEEIACTTKGWFSTQGRVQPDLIVAAYFPSDLKPEYTYGKGFVIEGHTIVDHDADILFASETLAEFDANGLVPLTFEHILAKVDFRIVHSLCAGIDVRLNKVEVKGFSKTGDYNLSGNQQWSVDSYGDSAVVYLAGDVGLAVTNEPQYVSEAITMIPQSCHLEIVATFAIRVGDGEFIKDEVSTGVFDAVWGQGRIHTYTLNLTDRQLIHTSAIGSWKNK